MFELEINNEVYQLNFGMGFLREVDKKISTSVDGLPGVKKNIGLNYKIASLIDGDIEVLEEVLDTANKGQKPRLTKQILDDYIEDEDTDIDELFERVLDFLKSANVTKRATRELMEEAEKRKAEAEKEQA
ncbi:MAG: tail assembly chaperone [Lachnospiraceae bacterium]|nr:tail assembly chaperone [Lachnospiraceae bacterium]